MKNILNSISAIILLSSGGLFPIIYTLSRVQDKINCNYKMLLIWCILHILSVSYVLTQHLLPPYNKK